uniref:RNA polymerase Rpb4/RPC9 core domain-containing protein n=1 Tax=viral metagenome TaxID=1070528 RepID=A0A6C0JPH7_9ZZZZ
MEENDAEILLFPNSFDQAETFTLSEVSFFLLKKGSDSKMLDYVTRFDKIKNIDNVKVLRILLDGLQLHKFETVQMINFLPNSSEECLILIPSLKNRFKDDKTELNNLIKTVRLL